MPETVHQTGLVNCNRVDGFRVQKEEEFTTETQRKGEKREIADHDKRWRRTQGGERWAPDGGSVQVGLCICLSEMSRERRGFFSVYGRLALLQDGGGWTFGGTFHWSMVICDWAIGENTEDAACERSPASLEKPGFGRWQLFRPRGSPSTAHWGLPWRPSGGG